MPIDAQTTTVFLCGDVMTGRGIDQILPRPSDPIIHEPYLGDARDYVELAEKKVNGAIPRSVGPAYIWGDALAVLDAERPDVRVINLETSITRSDAWEAKGINYRMHPENIACLTAAGVDVAVLANNHVLDWGVAGLDETIDSLRATGIRIAGAGLNEAEAYAPALVEVDRRARVLVFAFASPTSGVPLSWAASLEHAGIAVLAELSESTAREIGARIRPAKQPGDLVIASIHWGSNWGFEVPDAFVRFAHALIDGGVDVVHGHSSHHVRPIEVYRNRLILYGCGDFINDYEGIGGYEAFRGELSLMYFVTLDAASGELVRLRMVPMRMRKFSLHRAAPEEARWLETTLTNISRAFGASIERSLDGALLLRVS